MILQAFYIILTLYAIFIVVYFFQLQNLLHEYLDLKKEINPNFNKEKYDVPNADFSNTIYPFIIEEKETDEKLIALRNNYNEKLVKFRRFFVIGLAIFITLGILFDKEIISCN